MHVFVLACGVLFEMQVTKANRLRQMTVAVWMAQRPFCDCFPSGRWPYDKSNECHNCDCGRRSKRQCIHRIYETCSLHILVASCATECITISHIHHHNYHFPTAHAHLQIEEKKFLFNSHFSHSCCSHNRSFCSQIGLAIIDAIQSN